MFTTKKIATVSVINDLVSDNRVNKSCLTLVECGYNVVLIGRKLPNSKNIPEWPFKTIRMHLFFIQGPAFYFFFSLRLFFILLFKKTHLLYANDLDTLLPNFLVARIKNIPLIYDSHELFCEVPELQKTKIKRRIWLKLEEFIVPKLKYCITVNNSIARIFEEKYKTQFQVVRNVSSYQQNLKLKSREELELPLDRKIILLQGAGINIDRGAEELVSAMSLIDGALLLIIGSGDVWEVLQQKVRDEKLDNKIKLIYKLTREELFHYTGNADIGISIDKNTNLNYYYSLPNKLFDYIQAGIPILASRLPEIEKVINEYKVGDFIADHKPETIATKLISLMNSSKLTEYRSNALIARSKLTWENEKIKLVGTIKAAAI